MAPLFRLATAASPVPKFITLKDTETQVAKLRTRAHLLIDNHVAGESSASSSEEKSHSTSSKSVDDALLSPASSTAADERFQCPYCAEGNLTERGLVEHVLETHDDEDTQVVCPICASKGDHVLLHDFPAHLELRHMAALLDNPPPMPDRSELATPPSVEPSDELVQDLMQMGFLREWCVLALREQQNDMLAASTWIVDNLEMLNRLPRLDPLDRVKPPTQDQEDESDPEDEPGRPVDKMALLLKESGEIMHVESFPNEQQSRLAPGLVRSGSSRSALLMQPDLSLDVLLSELSKMERVLSILCARKGVLRLFSCLHRMDKQMDTASIHASHLPLLAKLLGFRGLQLGWEPSRNSRRTEGEDMLLRTMWNGFRLLVRSGPERFCPVLLTLALDAFAEAATKPHYRSTKWGHRECVVSDTAALTEPSVELAFWTFKLLASCAEAAPFVFGLSTFDRLLSYLYTANVHMKERICQCLKWTLHEWMSRPALMPASKRESDAGDNEPSKIEFVTALNQIPREKLKEMIDARAKVEMTLGKPFYSGYLRSLMVRILIHCINCPLSQLLGIQSHIHAIIHAHRNWSWPPSS